MSVFIAQLVPRDSESSNKGISQAAMNFCHNFILAINPKTVYALSLISSRQKQQFEFDNPRIRFIQCRFFPHFGVVRFANAGIENLKIVISILIGKENDIWFYNITAHNFLAFLLLKLLRKKCNIILADFEPRLTFNKFIKGFINCSNGIISFSSNGPKLFPNHNNIKKVPGIINKDTVWRSVPHPFRRDVVLFSGSLNDYAGIELALSAFSKLPEITLIITGSGGKESLVEQYADKYPNIKYKGHLEFDQYIRVMDQIDIVLSLRNPEIEGNLYNFPSKILEYFVNGKIVISTVKHPELPPMSYIYSEYGENQLITKVKRVANFSDDKIASVKSVGQEYVKNQLSYEVWSAVVKDIESH